MLATLNAEEDYSEEGFEDVFAAFDEDGSGTVEPAELSHFLIRLLEEKWKVSYFGYKQRKHINKTIQ